MKETAIPKILECLHFTLKSSCKNSRYVKDYEFDFYLNGERDMYIDGKHHKITEGILVFRKPGQLVESYGDYDLYTLTLDFSHKVTIPEDRYMRQYNPDFQDLCHHEIFDCIPETFFPYHQSEIKELLKKMTLCSYPHPINENSQRQLLTEFLLLVLADANRYNREKDDTTAQNHIEKACRFINNNYGKNITVSEIAAHLSINENYFIRLFKKELGITPNKYILNTRIFYAKNMLLQTDYSIKTIAFLCGFNEPSYFIKCFREKCGKSPGFFRKEKNSV